MKGKPDWGNAEELDGAPNYRLIWRSWGFEKTGKNYLGLMAPGPIAVHCLDVLGLEGTIANVKKQHPNKEIRVFKYRFNKTDEDAYGNAVAIRDQFLTDIQVSLKNARTVQVDETEIWEVFRYAEFGNKSDMPNNYDPLYAKYREWIHEFDHHPVSLQLIQKVKEKWENYEVFDNNGKKKEKGRPTGRYEPTGYTGLRNIVQANIEHTWDVENGFGIHVANCRQNMAIAGQTFYGIDFSTLAQLVFPESSEEDWR